ncbi:MAG: chemotaxis protein CheX [Bryobacteraceae bacterium]|nr:chemotaxis protein CheX [Bryobacteraceae bacterium]
MPETTIGDGVEDLLAATATEVLETMFFSAVLGTCGPEQLCPSEQVTVRLDFHGSPSGAFQITLPRLTARSIAATFLGEEEDDVSDIQAESVAGELLNMIAGAALSKLESDVTFRLETPGAGEPLEGSASSRAVHCCLELERGFLDIAFLAQEPE